MAKYVKRICGLDVRSDSTNPRTRPGVLDRSLPVRQNRCRSSIRPNRESLPLQVVAVSLLLSVGLLSLGVLVSEDDSGKKLKQDGPSSSLLTLLPHNPIFIHGNAGFAGANSSTGVTHGNGTASDPCVIEGWEIDASTARGINIWDTDVCFIIRDSSVHSGGSSNSGIVLDRVINGAVDNTTTSGNQWGIVLVISDDNTVTNNTAISNSYSGIHVQSSSRNTLANNTASSNGNYGIALSISSNNNILSNNVADSNGYSGISLDIYADDNILADRKSVV